MKRPTHGSKSSSLRAVDERATNTILSADNGRGVPADVDEGNAQLQQIASHRRALASYNAHIELAMQCTFQAYCGECANEVTRMLPDPPDRPELVEVESKTEHVAAETLPAVPKDECSPWLLPMHQSALRPPEATTVSWIRALPSFCTDSSRGRAGGGLKYTPDDVLFLLEALRDWARNLVATLRAVSHRVTPTTSASPPVSSSGLAVISTMAPSATARWPPGRSQRLEQAMSGMHAMGVAPSTLADEMIAVALCTIELPKRRILVAIETTGDGGEDPFASIYGTSRSPYAIINHTCRVARHRTVTVGALPPRPWSEDELLALQATLRLVAPIVIRVDTLLSRLPAKRRVLFRGVRLQGVTDAYEPGRLVAWHQLSSASVNWHVATRFGDTVFTIHAHSTAEVDFLSTFPREREVILPSYAVLRATGATSPTLLRMLNLPFNLVTLRELGDAPDVADIAKACVRGQAKFSRTALLHWKKSYVEGTVSQHRPPVAPWQPAEKLFEVVKRFLDRDDASPLLLLGEGGTGKTSALLAVYGWLCEPSRLASSTKPVVPVFLPLPKLQHAWLTHDNGDTIDWYVWQQLGVTSRAEAIQLSGIVTIVLLLDSLDECSTVGVNRRRRRGLLSAASFCGSFCKVVLTCRVDATSTTTSTVVVAEQKNTVWYLLPFDEADVSNFIDKFACCCKTTAARLRESLTLHGLWGEWRLLPVTLSYMLQVAIGGGGGGAADPQPPPAMTSKLSTHNVPPPPKGASVTIACETIARHEWFADN